MKAFTNNGQSQQLGSRLYAATPENIADDHEQALWVNDLLDMKTKFLTQAPSEDLGREYSNRQDIDSYC